MTVHRVVEIEGKRVKVPQGVKRREMGWVASDPDGNQRQFSDGKAGAIASLEDAIRWTKGEPVRGRYEVDLSRTRYRRISLSRREVRNSVKYAMRINPSRATQLRGWMTISLGTASTITQKRINDAITTLHARWDAFRELSTTAGVKAALDDASIYALEKTASPSDQHQTLVLLENVLRWTGAGEGVGYSPEHSTDPQRETPYLPEPMTAAPKNAPLQQEDIEALRRGYKTNGLEGAYAALPDRSQDSIFKLAVGLRIHTPRSKDTVVDLWTPDEDALMIKHYQLSGPTKMAKLIPRRSVLAIKKRASLLGLVYRPTEARPVPMGRPWTGSEITQVKAARDVKLGGGKIDWTGLLAKLPGRTRASVEAQLNAHLSSAPGRKARRQWSTEEDAYVIANIATLGTAKVAEDLGRSRAAVYNRACDLGVTKNHRDDK